MLTYESLHFTEKARRVDVKIGDVSTNTDHDSVDGVLCRMAIGLRHGTTTCTSTLVSMNTVEHLLMRATSSIFPLSGISGEDGRL